MARIATRWRERRVGLILTRDAARSLWRRARQFGVDDGGRYEAWRDFVLVWAAPCLGGREGIEPVGLACVAWRRPSPGHATLTLVAWDPARGATEAHVWRALGALADPGLRAVFGALAGR